VTAIPDRWPDVERIFHAALAHPDSERQAFVRTACQGDEALQVEVLSLVDFESRLAGFMDDGSALDVLAAQSEAETPVHELTGQRVGPYEIGPRIGAGGMGEVYRADDTKLGRAVAIKILPLAFARDAERRARFEREAQLLASLNHPHIGAIYGLEDHDGMPCLVLELIEGETLAARLRAGPIGVARALLFARQIADALGAAHARGIVHRDLKPANIMLTREGIVKLLDFGLAKARNAAFPSGETTTAGVVLGTPSYMSPEQARGETTDPRADVWAFGCVVGEMLSGQKTFAGQTPSDVIAAVLATEPAWDRLPPATPDAVRRMLRRCLEKDPARRLHNIADARIEIDDVLRGPVGEDETQASRLMWWRVAFVGGMVAIAAAVVVLGLFVRDWRESGAAATRLSISTPGFISPQLSAVVSPDGRRVAFVSTAGSGRLALWIRAFDDLDARVVPGSEDAAHPFWSPDGRFIAFQADGKVKVAEVSGASAVRVVADPSIRGGGAWSRTGQILFARSDGLAVVAASGGTASIVTASDPNGCRAQWPSFLPDGRRFLFFCTGRSDQRGVYVGSLDSKEKKLIAADALKASYASGYLFTVRGETLTAQPFDLDRLAVAGDPMPIANGIWTAPGAGQASFSVSNQGVLAYVNAAVSKAQFAWFDRAGRLQGRVGDGDRSFATPQLSPDARRLLVAQGPTAADHVWVMDASGTGASRLTFGAGRDYSPVWSPDATRFAYLSTGPRGVRVMVKHADGSGVEEEVVTVDRLVALTAWSPDGRYLVYTASGSHSLSDLWTLSLVGEKRTMPFLQSSFNKTQAQISPDGHWIAYTSYESGSDEVYVESFPTPGHKQQVSIKGGVQPRWRRDGKELFYLASNGQLMAMPVESGDTFTHGDPTSLFKTSVIPHGSQSIGLDTFYDASPDGQRFLCAIPSASDESFAPITVVLNWPALLKR